jgi:hypothetical protein
MASYGGTLWRRYRSFSVGIPPDPLFSKSSEPVQAYKLTADTAECTQTNKLQRRIREARTPAPDLAAVKEL